MTGKEEETYSNRVTAARTGRAPKKSLQMKPIPHKKKMSRIAEKACRAKKPIA